MRVHPGAAIRDIALAYDNKDPSVKPVLDSALKSHIVQSEGGRSSVNPPTGISRMSFQGYEVSYALAFLSDADIMLLTSGLPASTLGLKSISLRVEDGSNKQGYLVSFDGLPERLRDTCRSVKIFRYQALGQEDWYLVPSDQLVKEQAANTWSFVTTTELKTRCQGLRPENKRKDGYILSAHSIKQDAAKIVAQREQQEAQAAAKPDTKEGWQCCDKQVQVHDSKVSMNVSCSLSTQRRLRRKQ